METPKAGQIWRHFKHNPEGGENNYTYEIVGTSFDVTTDDPIMMVHYKPLYVNDFLTEQHADFFSRTLENFLGTKVHNGEEVQRFTRCV